VAERFIACAREVLESMCHRRKARAQSRA
jgi:hypothetical protein